MKKDLIIEMEEECVDCPMLSLETETLWYGDNQSYKIHKCEHLQFCKTVRQHWEDVMKRKVVIKNE